jgi:hypothetical protein
MNFSRIGGISVEIGGGPGDHGPNYDITLAPDLACVAYLVFTLRVSSSSWGEMTVTSDLCEGVGVDRPKTGGERLVCGWHFVSACLYVCNVTLEYAQMVRSPLVRG